MTLSTKQHILSVFDSQTKDIDAGAWGSIRIRSMSADERLMLIDRYQSDTLTNEQAASFYCELIALCVIDESNTRMFDSNGDIALLKKRDWPTIERVAQEVLTFNSMTAESAEETAKN